MARLWNFFATGVLGIFNVLTNFLVNLCRLPGRSNPRLSPESDVENQYEPLPSVDHSQNGSAREQEYAKKTEELQQLQGECSRLKDQIAGLEAQLKGERPKLQQLQGECSGLEAQIADLEAQLERERANSSSKIEELQTQLQIQRRILAEHYEGQIVAQREEIQRLVQQLELAEHQNSHDFAGGESFLDSGATPHLLNKSVERVNQTSGNFTKLLMLALKSGGVDCTNVAKALAPSVFFERPAHTKYVYQAVVCKVLFTDFESESFNIEENAPESLDPEQPRKDNFQRYQELIVLENPEELVYEDATDSDFRRFCNKKQEDLIAALSLNGAPGVDDVRALIFGEVFGPGGISRRSDSAGAQSQIKLASAFVNFALSVFLVHKLSFSMHPIARIFRVKDALEFSSEYMEPVVALADSDEEDAEPISLDVGFMVIPGFRVNRIVVHSRVYTVRRS